MTLERFSLQSSQSLSKLNQSQFLSFSYSLVNLAMAIYKLEGKRDACIKTYVIGSKVGNIAF